LLYGNGLLNVALSLSKSLPPFAPVNLENRQVAIDFNLLCDMCGRTVDGSKISPAAVRRAAKRQGIAVRKGNMDICADCMEAHREKTRQRAELR